MDNDGGITDFDTSSDAKSNTSSNDIVSSRGPYAYLLQWYDDGFDESVPTIQPGFVLPLSIVGSVADNEKKGKRNVCSDKSKEFLNPPPGFLLRVPIVGSFVDYEGKGKKLLELTSDQTI
ncbi:hypothetical protein Tco_1473550 [Tanacetum coccineum]